MNMHQPSYREQITQLPCNYDHIASEGGAVTEYKLGHRDAIRASEIVASRADATIKSLEERLEAFGNENYNKIGAILHSRDVRIAVLEELAQEFLLRHNSSKFHDFSHNDLAARCRYVLGIDPFDSEPTSETDTRPRRIPPEYD